MVGCCGQRAWRSVFVHAILAGRVNVKCYLCFVCDIVMRIHEFGRVLRCAKEVCTHQTRLRFVMVGVLVNVCVFATRANTRCAIYCTYA